VRTGITTLNPHVAAHIRLTDTITIITTVARIPRLWLYSQHLWWFVTSAVAAGIVTSVPLGVPGVLMMSMSRILEEGGEAESTTAVIEDILTWTLTFRFKTSDEI